MKGFGIGIRNDLLEPKHVEKMGQAVWLYMWLVDKMTSVTEEGVGLVLGGKPIKYDEVAAELGMSSDTYTRWIEKLSEYPYIQTLRTPHGIVFKVLKAKQKRYRKNAESFRKNAESNIRPTIDIQEDKDLQPPSASAETVKESDPRIKDFIHLFRLINPSYGRLFANKTERKASARLLKLHDLPYWTSFLAGYRVKLLSDKFCPRATKPSAVERKLGEIVAYGSSTRMSDAKKKDKEWVV